MRLHLDGHYWTYTEPRKIQWNGESIDGLCIREPARQIKVARRLRGKHRAEVQLHELAHAASFSDSEHFVTIWASSTTELLYATGVRLCRKPGNAGGAELIRNVLFHTLRIARHHLDDDEGLRPVADDLTRALRRLGWREYMSR